MMDDQDVSKQRRWWHLRVVDRPAPADRTSPDILLRPIMAADAESLATLMLDAYEGTIDSEGESIVEAREEVGVWIEHDWQDVVCSSVSTIGVCPDGAAACAVMVRPWEAGEVLIGYVITRPVSKAQGLGRMLVEHTLDLLATNGITTVRAAITVGNTPSERLFAGAGFTTGELIAAD